MAANLCFASLPTGRSDSPPHPRSFQQWRARRWPPARGRCARGAPGCRPPRRRRRTRSRPPGFRRGRAPELGPPTDPCGGGNGGGINHLEFCRPKLTFPLNTTRTKTQPHLRTSLGEISGMYFCRSLTCALVKIPRYISPIP